LAAGLMMPPARAQTRTETRNVAILIWDRVELLDFAGPGEVFAAAGGDGVFNVYTVGPTRASIVSQGFVTVTPEYGFGDSPKPDIIVVPGGGTSSIRDNPEMMAWFKDVAQGAEVVMSVCTGAFVLLDAGLLDGREATTWHGRIEDLREAAPKTVVHADTRFVDNGVVITTAGISAGIDGALHVVSRLLGEAEARSTARYMEYDKWVPEDGLVLTAGTQGSER
jgi:transcriptional regulator GlxA family with amidase domain